MSKLDTFLPQYAAQAVIDLERQTKLLNRAFGESSLLQAQQGVVDLIRNAVHVMLPDNGEVYRSNAWGGDIPNADERESFLGLPAPVTCFEYAWTYPKAPGDSAVGTRRITIAHDSRQTHEGEITDKDRFYTQIISVFYDENKREWQLYPVVVNIYQPFDCWEDRSKRAHGLYNWGMMASIQNIVTGEFGRPDQLTELEKKTLGEIRADINAVVQCCHSLRAGAVFQERTETSASRRWKFDKRGVGGFTYHVLKIPTHPRADSRESSGSHASPRFHIRRHHIRKLPGGTLTFVRQCFVGDKERGAVHKTYAVPTKVPPRRD